MNSRHDNAEELFAAALEHCDEQRRGAFLDQACGGDVDLRREVESLLEAHLAAGEFLKVTATERGQPGPPTEKSGDRIGRYKLLEQIGEGGFGVVWMAEQEEPVRRRVALKIIKLGMDTKEVVARFEAERQALAMMDHPNIASVFDGGATERPLTPALSPAGGGAARRAGEGEAVATHIPAGRPYFVMELVKGVPITHFCDERKLSTRERLELFMQVCQAVQHAHQKGIIHRDIKPSNVLVTVKDDRPVPKVIDFGVAKATQARLTEKTLFTRFQQWIGTPAYMSPEQAGLASLDVDTRSDVYSLGVLLYELLTGRTPFDTQKLLATGYEAVMRTIREEEPPKPSTRITEDLVAADVRRLDSKPEVRSPKSEADRASLRRLLQEVRGDLDWIVMKALEKDRQRRYGSATALAEDVERHLRAEPVLAVAPSAAYRLGRFVRRNRLAVATISLVLCALTTATIVSLRFASVARTERGVASIERDRARVQKGIAEAHAEESRLRLLNLNTAHGLQLMDRGDWFGASLWFCDALERAQTNQAVQTANRLRLGTVLAYSPRLVHAWFPGGPVNQASFSPDGLRVLAAARDGFARVWNVADELPVGAPLRHAGPVLSAEFSTDGWHIVTACEDGTTRVWETATGKPVTSPFSHPLPLRSAAFSGNGLEVVTASGREAWSWTPEGRLKSHPASSELRLWDAVAGHEAATPQRRGTNVQVIAVSPGGWPVAVAYADGEVRLFQKHLDLERRLGASSSPQMPGMQLIGPVVQFGQTSAPVKLPASGAGNGHAWIRPHEGPVVSVAWSADGKYLATAGADGQVLIHSLANDDVAHVQRSAGGRAGARGASLLQVAFSPDNQCLATLASDGTVAFWTVPRGEAAGQLDSLIPGATSLSFSPDGRCVVMVRAAAGTAGSVRLWEVASGHAVTPRLPHAGRVTSACFSPDGTRLLTASLDGGVRVWDLTTMVPGTPPLLDPAAPLSPQISQAPEPAAQRVEFSGDGRRVAILSPDGAARVWQMETGQPVGPAIQHDQPYPVAAFRPDGQRLAVGGQFSGQARVFDVATGKAVSPALPHVQAISRLAFTPDGRGLIIAGPQPVRVVDATTGEPLSLKVPMDARVRDVALSPDGRWLATCALDAGSAGGTNQWVIQLWDAASGQRSGPELKVTAVQTGWLADLVPTLLFSDDAQWLAVCCGSAAWGRPDAPEPAACTTRIFPRRVGSGAWPPEPLEQSGLLAQCEFARGSHWLVFGNLPAEELTIRDLDTGALLPVRRPQEVDFRARAISHDARWVLGEAQGGWRVWELASGEPVTPVLSDASGLAGWEGTLLSPDGTAVLAGSWSLQAWRLGADERPVEAVRQEVELLAARELHATGSMLLLSQPELSNRWQTVRSARPAPGPNQAAWWHLSQAGLSERAKQWFATEFHLSRLLDTPCDGPQIRERLAHARAQAALEMLNRKP